MFRSTDLRWLDDLIARFRGKRILVIGDLMLDEFVWGRVSRLSPEAPVPIVEVSEQSFYPGGAANVARNLREFTDQVAVMGVVGNDPHAEILKGLLVAQGISLDGLQQSPEYRTIVKTRIIARQQHVVRVDRESRVAPDDACHERAIAQLETMLPGLDAIIIEDYAKGFLTQSFVERIGTLARRAGKVLTVDPNPRNDLQWTGVTAIKPNRAEAFHVAGLPLTEVTEPPAEDPALLQAAQRLLARWDTEMLLITLGEQGMLLFRRGETPYLLPPCRREVFDLSGAGDTAIALFTLSLAANASPEQAAEIANHAGSVVVGKLGTATLTAEELVASFETSSESKKGPPAPAVFVDRDGTLMEDIGYCGDPARVHVFQDAAGALGRLRAHGFRVIMITNQSGIGRQYFSEADYHRVQTEVFRQLGGRLIDASYYCPDAPADAVTGRRKPAPGMIFEAAREHGLDLGRSYMIGDSARDLECGRAAGLAAGVLVLTGKGRNELARSQPDFTAANLEEAVDWILRQADPENG